MEEIEFRPMITMDIPGQGNVIQFNSANLTVGYCVPNIDIEGWKDSVSAFRNRTLW